MPPKLHALHAWLATARIANVPSVISNVWLGMALGACVAHTEYDSTVFIYGAVLALAGVLLYIGGNFLNDWHDREWDETHRPERALPSGVFSPLSYLIKAIRFMGLGVVLACMVNVPCAIVAVLIVVLIVIYTRWHKKAVWPVIPMGLCRALLPVMGFVALNHATPQHAHDTYAFMLFKRIPVHLVGAWKFAPFVAMHAAGLFCWIVGLSLTARYESIPNPPPGPKSIARLLLFVPLLAMSASWMRLYPLQTIIGMVPFLAWTVPLLLRRHSVPVLVSGFLAGIPLVEWIAAFPIANHLVPGGESLRSSPISIITMVLPPLAFMVGRRLQKVASAT